MKWSYPTIQIFILIFVGICVLLASTKCPESYRSGRSIHDARGKFAREDDKNGQTSARRNLALFTPAETKKLSQLEEQVKTLLKDSDGKNIGGKLNCTVCAPCLDKKKACNYLCHYCNAFCIPNKCDFANMYNSSKDDVRKPPRILNAPFYANLRLRPTLDPNYRPDQFSL